MFLITRKFVSTGDNHGGEVTISEQQYGFLCATDVLFDLKTLIVMIKGDAMCLCTSIEST